jgi:hypothetical protein
MIITPKLALAGIAIAAISLTACGGGGSAAPAATADLSFQCQLVAEQAYSLAVLDITNDGSAVTDPAYDLVLGYDSGGRNTFSKQYDGTIAPGQTVVTRTGVAASTADSCAGGAAPAASPAVAAAAASTPAAPVASAPATTAPATTADPIGVCEELDIYYNEADATQFSSDMNSLIADAPAGSKLLSDLVNLNTALDAATSNASAEAALTAAFGPLRQDCNGYGTPLSAPAVAAAPAYSATAPATPTPTPPVFGCYVNDNEPGSDAEYGASINIVSGGDGYSSAVVKVVIFDSHGEALQTQTVTAYSSTENWQVAIDPEGGPPSLATESTCTATVESAS